MLINKNEMHPSPTRCPVVCHILQQRIKVKAQDWGWLWPMEL